MATETMVAEKLPPQNIEAEMSVLGSMLIEENAFSQAVELLTDESFYQLAHRKIFQAMLKLYESGRPIDVVTLVDELRTRKQLDETGGSAYIASLSTYVPTAANLLHYARMVKEKQILRKLIAVSTRIITDSYEANMPAMDMMEDAQKKLYELAINQIEGRVTAVKDVVSSPSKR